LGRAQIVGGDVETGQRGLGLAVGQQGGVEVAGLLIPGVEGSGFVLVQVQVGLALGVALEGQFGQTAVVAVDFVGRFGGVDKGLGGGVLLAVLSDLGVVQIAGGVEQGLPFCQGGGIVAVGFQGGGNLGVLLGVGQQDRRFCKEIG
jgi:hypothetical protein